MAERTVEEPTKGKPDEAGTGALLEKLRELEPGDGATLHLYRKYKSPGRGGKTHWSVAAYLDAPAITEERPFGYHCAEVVPRGGLLGTNEAVSLVLSLRFDHHRLAPYRE